MRHTVTFVDSGATGAAITINLAAPRLISYGSAGKKSVYFNFNRIQMDLGISCWVTSAAFTVTTYP